MEPDQTRFQTGLKSCNASTDIQLTGKVKIPSTSDFVGVSYGKNRPKSENLVILTPPSSATVGRTKKDNRTFETVSLCSASRDL